MTLHELINHRRTVAKELALAAHRGEHHPQRGFTKKELDVASRKGPQGTPPMPPREITKSEFRAAVLR